MVQMNAIKQRFLTTKKHVKQVAVCKKVKCW